MGTLLSRFRLFSFVDVNLVIVLLMKAICIAYPRGNLIVPDFAPVSGEEFHLWMNNGDNYLIRDIFYSSYDGVAGG